MKKRLSLLFIILLVISLSACDIKTEQAGDYDLTQEKEQVSRVENDDTIVKIADEETLEQAEEETDNAAKEAGDKQMKIQIGETTFTATMAQNSSAEALIKLLAEGPITIDMRDYGSMEKVGSLGTDLPRNDEQITTEPGDLILFQGSAFVIYYAPNSWN